MVTLEYPNGYFCTYKSMYCAEGYRYGCQKCLSSAAVNQQSDSKDWTKDMWESRSNIRIRRTSKLGGLFAPRLLGY